MSPRTRSMANMNRNHNDFTGDRDGEGPARSQSSTPRLQPLSGSSPPSSSSSSSSSLSDDHSGGPPPDSPIFDPPDRRSTTRVHIWRQGIRRQFRPARLTFWIVLATVSVWLLPWSFFLRPEWTLDATLPDFHIVNDANLLCLCANYGYSAGYISVDDRAPKRLSPPRRMSPGGKSIGSSNNNSSSSTGGGETVGNVEVGGLRYDNAPLRAIGHVHLQLCVDDGGSTGTWWHMHHRCNRTELFTLDPVLFIRTAKTNRISFGLLARHERELGRSRSLPLGVWRDGQDGSVVVSGKIIKASLRQVFRKRSWRQ